MQTIYHKKNELFEVEFFKDEECTEAFDLTNARELYIDGMNGDITPLTAISDEIRRNANIYTPYIPQNQKPLPDNIKTLDDITPNLSKYIPKDNAVLFLSRKDKKAYVQFFINHNNLLEDIETYKIALQIHNIDTPKSITIFLHHGTQSELQKAEEVGKYLWENFGIKPNLCALHWFGSEYQENDFKIKYLCKDFGVLSNFNKIITTNSTGILPVQDNERLQVIDGKEIFKEYLKENN